MVIRILDDDTDLDLELKNIVLQMAKMTTILEALESRISNLEEIITSGEELNTEK
jgi:hypothetical protein